MQEQITKPLQIAMGIAVVQCVAFLALGRDVRRLPVITHDYP